MTAALPLSQTTTFAIELHDFIREIDAARWRAEMQAALSKRLDALISQLGQLTEPTGFASDAGHDAGLIQQRLGELARVLREYAPEAAATARAARLQWRQLRSRLLPAYEALGSTLRARAVAVPSIRPTNTARIALHMAAMLLVMTLLQLPISGWGLVIVAGLAAGTCWVLETLRRDRPRLNDALMSFFHHVAHPLEAHRVNSATWYATALFILAWLFLVPGLNASLVGGAAVVVLGVGDPLAGLVGRRWGRTRLVNHRTLEGTIAFWVTSFLAVLLFGVLLHASHSWQEILTLAGATAFVGGIAELFSRRLDDNLTIPVCAAAAAWLVLELC